MGQPLRVSRAQDYVAHLRITPTASNVPYAFTPLDYTGVSGQPISLFAEEVLFQNLDTTNNAYVRLALANTAKTSGVFVGPNTAPTSRPPDFYTTDTTTFPAAVVTDIVIPAGARNVVLFARCVGLSVIGTAGAAVLDVTAFGTLIPNS